MTDYRAVMKLLVQQRSYRQIEQQLGCSHRAISRSNQVLRSLGIRTVDQVLALTDDELDELFVDGVSALRNVARWRSLKSSPVWS